MSNIVFDYLEDEDGEYSAIAGDRVNVFIPQEHIFVSESMLPDLKERESFPDVLASNLGVSKQDVSINYSTTVSFSVVESGAGYNNTLGAYTVGADGSISHVNIAYGNVKVPLKAQNQINKLEQQIDKWQYKISKIEENIKGVDPSSKRVEKANERLSKYQDKIDDLQEKIDDTASQGKDYTYEYHQQDGSSLGVFIIADGADINKNYSALDLENGTLNFVYDFGGEGERAAKVTDSAKTISLVYELDGATTLLKGNIYHATDSANKNAINPDGKQHTVSGLANVDDPSVLRMGFEDLKNLGDADYNDVVIDIRVSKQDAIEPNYDDVLLGDASDNIFIGGLGDDFISGRGGSDTVDYSAAGENLVVDLNALFGTDYSSFTDRLINISNVIGTQFADQITGSAKDNILYSFAGNDIIHSGSGNDLVYAGAGNDYIEAGAGDDEIYGEDGNDTIEGFDGGDTLIGGDGEDIIWGGAGNDTLHGDAGRDLLYGQDGDDSIYGGAGNDYIEGGSGNDFIQSGQGSNTLYGGKGIDTADYSDRSSAMRVALSTGTAIEANGDKDTLFSIENVTGTNFADTMEGGTQDNILIGLNGNDNLYGWSGNDTLIGGAGRDLLYGHDGNDTIYGGDGNDYIEGGAGDDILFGGTGLNTMYGGTGMDNFVFNGETAFDAMDYIKDFEGGEKLDISDVLSDIGYNDGSDVLGDWVQITSNAYHSYVRIDQDGTGDTHGFTNIVITEGYNALTVDDLIVSSTLTDI